MKRFIAISGVALIIAMTAGCDSGGIEEGMPKDIPADAMPPQLKAEMEKNAAKMKMKKSAPKPSEKTKSP